MMVQQPAEQYSHTTLAVLGLPEPFSQSPPSLCYSPHVSYTFNPYPHFPYCSSHLQGSFVLFPSTSCILLHCSYYVPLVPPTPLLLFSSSTPMFYTSPSCLVLASTCTPPLVHLSHLPFAAALFCLHSTPLLWLPSTSSAMHTHTHAILCQGVSSIPTTKQLLNA